MFLNKALSAPRINTAIFLFVCGLLAPVLSLAGTQSYLVKYVYDGDTVLLHTLSADVNANVADFKLRLTNIDAPERQQMYGVKARRALMKLCQSLSIQVHAEIADAKDKYGRSLGKLQCNGVDASTYMLQQGLAWHYVRFSQDADLAREEAAARSQKRGLWADEASIAPWDWRKLHPH